jgi:Kef-type K+ transport system membrane component KefB
MEHRAQDIPELDRKGLREFGLLTGGIVAGLFGLVVPFILGVRYPLWPWIVFAVLGLWALLSPGTLRPVYRGWMRFGLLLSRVTTPVIMTAVFVLAIVPGALVMKAMGRDPMARRLDGEQRSYRIESRKPSRENLEKPF